MGKAELLGIEIFNRWVTQLFFRDFSCNIFCNIFFNIFDNILRLLFWRFSKLLYPSEHWIEVRTFNLNFSIFQEPKLHNLPGKILGYQDRRKLFYLSLNGFFQLCLRTNDCRSKSVKNLFCRRLSLPLFFSHCIALRWVCIHTTQTNFPLLNFFSPLSRWLLI